MRKKTCLLEKEVVDGLKREKLTPEIKKHVFECPYCQDIVTAHEWMNRFQNMAWSTEVQEKTLPDPEILWNRAHVRRRPDKKLVNKALRPLIFPRIFSYGVLIVGVILFIANIKKIGNFLDSSAGAGPLLDAISKMTQILPYFLLPMVVVIISMLFCVFVVASEKRKKPA